MTTKTGLEIVRLHTEYQDKINELEDALAKLGDHSYTQLVIKEKLDKLRTELQGLEGTRFQALDPVVIVTSLLGGK